MMFFINKKKLKFIVSIVIHGYPRKVGHQVLHEVNWNKMGGKSENCN
jgi:hypothetical protein